MKMGKRLLSAALAVCVLLFAALPAAAQETKYPTTWDLTDLYEDDAACEAAINAVQEDLEELRSFLGTLDDEAAIDGFFTCYAESTGFEQLLRIYLYGYLGTPQRGRRPGGRSCGAFFCAPKRAEHGAEPGGGRDRRTAHRDPAKDLLRPDV